MVLSNGAIIRTSSRMTEGAIMRRAKVSDCLVAIGALSPRRRFRDYKIVSVGPGADAGVFVSLPHLRGGDRGGVGTRSALRKRVVGVTNRRRPSHAREVYWMYPLRVISRVVTSCAWLSASATLDCPASAAENSWPTVVPMPWNSGMATNWPPV